MRVCVGAALAELSQIWVHVAHVRAHVRMYGCPQFDKDSQKLSQIRVLSNGVCAIWQHSAGTLPNRLVEQLNVHAHVRNSCQPVSCSCVRNSAHVHSLFFNN